MEPDRGKLFIGGISWDTTEETLRDYFSRYGRVADAVIMRDRNTGSARGFGFVAFADPSDADRALQDKHALAGRAVDVKKAVARREQQQQQNQGLRSVGSAGSNSRGSNTGHQRTKKIFVGGLPANLSEDEFRRYFEQFGAITDVVVMFDSGTQRPRGFGFITFEKEEAVDKVLQKSFHELNEKLVEVKRAVPKEGQNDGRGRGFGDAAVRTDNRYGGNAYEGYGPVGYVAPPSDGAYGSGGFGYGSVVPSAGPTQFGGGYANGPGVRGSWIGVMAPGYGVAPPNYGSGGQNTQPVYGYGEGVYSSGGYGGGGGAGYAVASYIGYGVADPSAAGGAVFGGGDGSYGAGGRQSQNQRGPVTRFRPYP